MSVQIDWMEMLKYWTEIKSKYHIETEFDDDADDYSDTKNTKDTTVNGSELVIKDLYLRINTHSHTSTNLINQMKMSHSLLTLIC